MVDALLRTTPEPQGWSGVAETTGSFAYSGATTTPSAVAVSIWKITNPTTRARSEAT